MSILDHELITERYFFPRSYAVPNPTWVDVDGARLACYAEDNGNPFVVVFFHGNGEVVADYVPHFIDYIAEVGADCFLAEYRGYGKSTGTPQLGKMLEDIPAIFEAVDRPPEEIIVFGRSVGSIYAIEFANRYPDIAGLILESGIADPLERILLRVSPEELGLDVSDLKAIFDARLDNLGKLKGRTRPTLVMHSEHDDLVDVSHAVRLASAPEKNCRLVLFEHGDHNSIFALNRREYVAEVGELIATCFRGDDYGPADGDETIRDTIEVDAGKLERTTEYGAPRLDVERQGPGQTAEISIPEKLRQASERSGPGGTLDIERPKELMPDDD